MVVEQAAPLGTIRTPAASAKLGRPCFSLFFCAQTASPDPLSERQCLYDGVEMAVLADGLGFDRIWVAEHHAVPQYAHLSAPDVFLSFVAARTSKIRLGRGVVCLPFAANHPVRVAERLATLDILSKGRVDFGFGRGATDHELGCFGLTTEQAAFQVAEACRMIPAMWTQPEFSWHSEQLTVPKRTIIPRPYQYPHPPLFMACTRDATLEIAAQLGVGALTLGFGGPQDAARKRHLYATAAASRDDTEILGAFVVEHMTALCPAMVLDDGPEAVRLGRRGQRFFVDSLRFWAGDGPPPAPNEVETASFYNPNHAAYGTVDQARAYIGALLDAGVDEVMFLVQMGTVPAAAVMQTIKNLGERVLPHFRA